MKKGSAVGKGQTSLFSFFNKPKETPTVAAAVAAVTPSSNIIKNAYNDTLSSGGTTNASDSSPNFTQSSKTNDNDDDDAIVSSKNTSNHKRGRILLDDDEEDAILIDSSAASVGISKETKVTVNIKKVKNSNSDDEVWDGNDSEEDEDDNDDGDDDASYDSTVKKSSKKRSNSKKLGTTSNKKTAYASVTNTPKTPSSSYSQKSTASHSSSVFDKCTSSSMNTPMSSNDDSFMCNDNNNQLSSSTEKQKLMLPEGVNGPGTHEHNSFSFLLPKNRKDINQYRPEHPEYNPRTLYIEPSFMREQTPAMEQWWRFKQHNMDTVLFFKVGKFYELFHMDADVGMSELNLIYMKGSKAHSGFPEISYGKFASQLVSKGYRVARVEQTETPEMLKERNDSRKGTKDKVVKRELCSVMSKGTRTYCHLDDLYTMSKDGNSNSVLICIKETTSMSSNEDGDDVVVAEYGICCIDTIIGLVTLAQFQDDCQRSRLRTMISKYTPSEVLVDTLHTPETLGVIKLLVPKACIETLRGHEMPESMELISTINTNRYFVDNEYPAVLDAVIKGGADGSTSLLLCAIGGALWQLSRSLIDHEIFSMGKFLAYIPPDSDGSDTFNHATATGSGINGNEIKMMTLDATALHNLEILVNNFDKTEKGSLWAFVNRCSTSFGKRVLKDWLVHPLYQVDDIKSRSDAINDLLNVYGSEYDDVKRLMKTLPDLERLLSRVHSIGLKKKVQGSKEHPDCRAVMYEGPVYTKRKIKDFAEILNGFETVLKIVALLNSDNSNRDSVRSLLLKSSVLSTTNNGMFPYERMSLLLKHFRTIFDEEQAKKEGTIKPRKGIDAEYDAAKEDICNIEAEFETYLKDMKKKIGVSDIKYFGSNKDRYQLEVPMACCGKVPRDWMTKSQKKTHRRYRTPEIEALLVRLFHAEDRLKDAQNDTLRRIMEKFDDNRHICNTAVSCIALLDCLMSLAAVSSGPNYNWPIFADKAVDGVVLNIQGGRHPMLEYALSQRGDGDYIPNTTCLGGVYSNADATCSQQTTSNSIRKEHLPKLMLLSGPNMGGKSTLLRQTCLITILAQLGCKVPADSCIMTPVDRIFTRVGASDRILAGQSTFFVELSETATMLKFATEDSLGILDELGRGTATFDGTAIAHAVIDYLVKHTKCRTLFATHYHSLIDDWNMDPRIKLGHMDCIVDTAMPSNSIDTTTAATAAQSNRGNEEVTFLYRLCDGSSPRSYGINVAKLARLPADVIALAIQQSKELEDKMKACSDSDTVVGNPVDIGSRNVISAFYEKLVSVCSSDISDEEFLYVTAELWHRYQSTKSVA